MEIKTLNIPGPEGILKGEILQISQEITNLVILCHPHPQYGGDMNNNVIQALFHAIPKLGWSVVRFNFRGVSGSAGKYGNIIGEQEDLNAVTNFLMEKHANLKKIILCGYSFGAVVAGAVYGQYQIYKAFVAISYPITFIPDFKSSLEVEKPKFFIIGDRDDFTSLQAFNQFFQDLPNPKQKKIISNVDHFWGGKEKHLVDEISSWIKSI